MKKTALIIILILITLSTLGASKVISSQTLTIYGSIPERTTVSVDANGLPLLTSNSFNADCTVVERAAGSYLLSVTAL